MQAGFCSRVRYTASPDSLTVLQVKSDRQTFCVVTLIDPSLLTFFGPQSYELGMLLIARLLSRGRPATPSLRRPLLWRGRIRPLSLLRLYVRPISESYVND